MGTRQVRTPEAAAQKEALVRQMLDRLGGIGAGCGLVSGELDVRHPGRVEKDQDTVLKVSLEGERFVLASG